MLSRAVESYLSERRAAGLHLGITGFNLRSFAAYADGLGQRWVNCQTAIDWAAKVPSIHQRARRLGDVERLVDICAPKMHATKSHPRSSAVQVGLGRLRTSSATSRSASSSSWLPSRATELCEGRPTARCSR